MVNLSRGKIRKQQGPHTQAIGFKQGSGKKISILMLQGEANCWALSLQKLLSVKTE